MNFLSILMVAVALALDAFSVSITAGLFNKKPDFGYYFRLSFHFGFFQFIMPVLGYFLGTYLGKYVRSVDHWIAFGLLIAIGIKMIYDSYSDSGFKKKKDPSRGFTLIFLAIATSIDALAIGITLGILNKDVFFPSLVIGVVCMIFSVLGIVIGKTIGKFFNRIEIFGGVILILIGLKILIEHLYFS